MKKYFYIISFCIVGLVKAQQDPLYSQYQFNQLMINPAYAGVYDRFAVGVISRFQWAGIEGAPQTNTITASSSFSEGKIGLGGLVLNDRFGVNNNYEIQIAGSYNIQFDRFTKLAMGLQGGWIQYTYDFSDINFDFMDDPEIMQGHENFSKPNFGVGFMVINTNYFIGASIPRILNVSITDGSTQSQRYKRHYYLSGGAVVEINQIPVKSVALLRSFEGETLSADLSISAFLDDVMWAGITVRDLKHFGVLGIIEASKSLRIGYSFELPTNNLVYGNYGTHEVSITYSIRYGFGRQEPIFF